MEYTSKGVGNAALTTGIIGTALGAFTGAGGISGILGRSADPGDRPVTRYEMDLIRENITLKSEQYTDRKAEFIEGQISQQLAYNAGANAMMATMNQQIQSLFGLTKMMIPADEVVPAASGS